MSRRAAVGVSLLLIGLVAWLGWRGYQLRQGLVDARATLSGLSGSLADDDAAALDRDLAVARRHVERARSAANDPLWRLAAAVPVAGNTFEVGRGAAEASHRVLDEVVPPAQDALDLARDGSLLRQGRVDLTRLAQLTAPTNESYEAATAVQRDVQALPSTALLPAVARERRALLAEVDRLTGALRNAKTALGLAPGMLGAERPRRYFLAVQNNAETRGTGGLVGAYAILRAERGRISRERVGSDLDLKESPVPVVDLGQDFSELYDADSARAVWPSAVLTPDWPSASRIMAGLWNAQGGGRVDGVLGLDPIAMAPLLRATGPVRVGATTVTGDNVVDFVMRDEYALFPDVYKQEERKRLLSQLAAAMYEKVVSGGAGSLGVLRAMAEAGASGHVQIWSADPAEQSVLRPSRVGAALPAAPGAFLEVVSNNAAGNKADYYVRRKVAYERPRDGTGRVTVTLSNVMKPQGLPQIVTGRFDKPQQPVELGDTRQIVNIFVGVGKRVRSVTVDGETVPFHAAREQGHGVASLQVEIRPSRPVVIAAEIEDPGGELIYRQQPLVVPDELDIDVPHRVS